ncbi:hypothetical protein AB0M94_27005 [Streptomyces xanthochromogenes]|uniref:hypothetical protein n=1 Tax=Streptomyces xanthochromogenes TaxID=67384 RepID=UPI0034249262
MTSFAAEWAQLKAAAAERSSMRLASAGGGNDGAGLRSDSSVWNAAGNAVAVLAGDTTKALTGLDGGQRGLGADAGVESAAAQRELHQSWQQYLHALGDRCDGLQDLLRKAGSDQHKSDHEIEAALAAVKAQYKDTPAVGGQETGR